MSSIGKKKKGIFGIFRQIKWPDVSLHIIFWTLVYIIMLILDDKEMGLAFAMGKELLQTSFFAIIVYVNLYFLFPNYLTQKSIWWHILSLAMFALIITPIRIVVFYLLYSNQPDIQSYFIDNQYNIFLSSFFVGVTSTIFNIMRDWLNNQRVRQELHSRTLQSELNFLKSQINPHFLFNTLNNLYALTLKKSDLAPEIVLKLSEMMRYMLYECNEREVPLQKEVNYIENYLELEKLRQGNRFEINFNVQGMIGNQRIAPLLFIPFIENSFKHGVSNQLREGYVNIMMLIEADEVSMSIENSKAPTLPSPNHKKSGGIGLVNVRRRLNLLYPGKYDLDIENNPNSYKVNLNVELY